MTTDKNLWEEQVSRAKNLLENLPPKDSKKTRQEAANELEEDFKKAMSNGYTAAKISDILKNEGIDIPAQRLPTEKQKTQWTHVNRI